ncbi:FAD-binding oxidoreductase [Streptomyces sp. ISL-36]|uniref:FAD-binding oxidoreductase n=1 Tax=Streptomyces sp. ISL-36 TaxID=2819182 RepID=UPI001BEB18EF|nr:FAD-binding oxidoreductase [Streptomyces sp. ISL-36]MBT2439313.1 FAD-binding oxidoreductase [Streptomyces sp. ISL-36]
MSTLSVELSLENLRGAVRGDVVVPGDPSYEEARRVYNALHDRRPAVVVRAVDAGDVIAAVLFAREHELRLAVRGGSHAVAGHGTVDDGLVIDLSRMRGVRVDPAARTARAEGGCTWGDFNHATHAFGLATTGGVISTTGVGGLTLGGGMGNLSRRYGLSCDNLLAADVVTAEGTLVTCDAERHPDLFWALRGGGGNYGVVTSFRFRVHPVSDILGGVVIYPLDGEVARRWRDMNAEAEEELNTLFVTALGPQVPFLPERWQGRPVCVAVVCFTGRPEDDERVRARLASLGPVVGEFLDRIPYPLVNTLFDEDLPPGLYHYWKGNFSRELSDGAIGVHMAFGETIPSLQTETAIFPIDGACHRVGAQDTAFAYRDASFSTAFGASYTDPADTERNIAWTRAYDDALRPHTQEGGYVNFMDADDQSRVRSNYRQNYDRLRAVKRRYDPDNTFRLNHNIAP